ncbi:MAG: PEP-CTERM sorting domain-containing protein [Opitutales bacterium]|nr:PEP-CTERM sorting domain-containing protein [Opitutales bacterium]
MKKAYTLPILFGFALTSYTHGSTITVAEWNFNNFTQEELDGNDYAGLGEEIDADVGAGLFTITEGPSGGTNFRRSSGGGTEVNRSDNTEDDGGMIFFRRGQRWHDGEFEYRVDTTGFTDLNFSFAMDMDSTAPEWVTVSWKIGESGTLNTLDTIENPVDGEGDQVGFDWTAFSYDLSGETAVNDQSDLRFHFQFASDGAGSTTSDGTRMDNVLITAIPEPSTYAALFGLFALGMIVWRRRKRS